MSVTVLGLVAADFDARVSQLEELENRTDLAAFCHRCVLIWEAVLFLWFLLQRPCSDHALFSVWQRLSVPSSPQLLRASSSHRCTASTIRPPGRSATSASSSPTVLQLEQSVVRYSTLGAAASSPRPHTASHTTPSITRDDVAAATNAPSIAGRTRTPTSRR